MEGNLNICCSFGYDTVTPHHPFFTLSAFHLWTVMLTLFLAWRQSLHFSPQFPPLFFLKFSVDDVFFCQPWSLTRPITAYIAVLYTPDLSDAELNLKDLGTLSSS